MPKQILTVSDSNTYKAFGKDVEEKLKEAEYKVKNIILNREGDLVPGKRAIGRVLVKVDEVEIK